MKTTIYTLLILIPFTLLFSQNIPYPMSERFESIAWQWDTYYYTAPGSDLWPVTWDINGHIQTSWGDGGGFDGDDIIGRVSLGFARIEGTPTDLQPHHNVWGGYNALNPATFEGKCESMISVNGILYGWLNTQNNPSSDPPDFKIIWSTDLAATWSLSDWSFPSNDTFFPFAFLNFGMDNSGARDEFVYSYGGRWIVTQGQENNIYLMRVHKNQILNRPDYQFFTGLDNDGNALWSYNINDRQSMFNDSNGITGNPSVIYNPDLGIYILTVSHGGIAKLGVFAGTEPWGPWETLGYYDNWGGFDNSIGMGIAYNIPTKWISEDGKSMWVIFSSENFLDRFNEVKFNLIESPLAVEMENLSAVVNINSVILNWTTSTEISNFGFEVHRREWMVEGIETKWENIAFVKGHGNSNSIHHYSFSDKSLKSGKYFYRLKQIDTDGTTEIYNFDLVEVDIPNEFSLEQNYPNPFNPTTVIEFSIPENAENVTLTVYNALGENVAELVKGGFEPGVYQYNWNAVDFSSGLYIYELRTEKFHAIKKMLLLK